MKNPGFIRTLSSPNLAIRLTAEASTLEFQCASAQERHILVYCVRSTANKGILFCLRVPFQEEISNLCTGSGEDRGAVVALIDRLLLRSFAGV